MERMVDKLIVHVSDTPDHMDVGFEQINEWHRQAKFTPYNNWIYCGYHYIISRDGIVFAARPEAVAGIHCSGQNSNSVAVCWVGRDLMSADQQATILKLCLSIMRRHHLNQTQVFGHHEFNAGKTCPNFKEGNLYSSMDQFRAALQEHIEGA